MVKGSKLHTWANCHQAKAVRNWFYVSSVAHAPIWASQLANIHNGKCIAHWFFKILKIINTNFRQTMQYVNNRNVLCWKTTFMRLRDLKHRINYTWPNEPISAKLSVAWLIPSMPQRGQGQRSNYPDNWLDTSLNLKPDNNHHLRLEFWPANVSQNMWVCTCTCTCVIACIERSSWHDPGHDHGDGVTLIIIVGKSFTMTLHAQIWPVLSDYRHEYYWWNGAIRMHQSRAM
jgi:hypothetical protein